MIPLHDDNPTQSRPVVTYALIAANLLVFLYQLGAGDEVVYRLGLIPFMVSGHEPTPGQGYLDRVAVAEHYNFHPAWATIFTSMFLHASWWHLLGNMLFLGIFGNNVEDALGKFRYAVFYLLCGTVGAAAQILLAPGSSIPTIGASGAIAGVLAGYFILFPRARVTCLVVLVIIINVIELPAQLVLGLWIVMQIVMGLGGWAGQSADEGGVAYAAHVGGFLAGLMMVRAFGGSPAPPRPRYYPQPDEYHWR